jgi:periplasmic protein TonB
MDRAEKIGLGSAVGGHALLIAAFYLGLLSAAKELPRPEPIAVSLVGEVADVSSAPDATQEEPAPSAAAQSDPAEPPPTPEVMQIERPVEMPVARSVEKPTPRDIARPDPRAIRQTPIKPATAAKPATAVSGKGRTPAKPGGFSDSFERAITGASRANGQGKAPGTPATKTSAQVRSAVTVSLRNEISPFFKRCAPSGVDVNEILTRVTLNIGANGALIGVSDIRQSGINDSNRAQAGLHKDCAIKAAKAASPFQNLPVDAYDMWKNWPMDFKTR